MKQIYTIIFFLIAFQLGAQDYGQDMSFKIWNNRTAPHSNGLTAEEITNGNLTVRNISQAMLYIYHANPAKNTGKAIVICPGGGYGCVCMKHEGRDIARWLASEGVTCGVLKYRLPYGHKEVPLEDGIQALRIMREHADELKIRTDQVGIMGFSAGGHLAAYISNFAADRDKPDFSVLFYPVITGQAGICHKGSFDNLLGHDAGTEERERYSLDRCVTETTPPALLLLSDADQTVPPVNSTLYYNALKAHGIQASLHIYPAGYHGWGNRPDFGYFKEWHAALLDWLKHLDY